MTILNGYLTYIVAGITVVWGAVGYFLGTLDPVTAGQTVLAGLAAFGVRRAIANS